MIVDPDFIDHWKTLMLVGLLGGDKLAPVYVLRIWAHCQNRRQWVFDNLSPDALKGLCRFDGAAAQLETALSQAGFIRRDGDKLVVCNWEEYNRTLIAAWRNGARNGLSRPPQPTGTPTGTPTGPRLDGMGLDGIGEGEVSPSTPSADKPRKKPAKKRKQDELFDAVAEVTATDPKTSGSYVGRVCKALREADPPYTPAEVRSLPSVLAANKLDVPMTLGVVEKYIGWTRKPPPKSGSAPTSPPVDPVAEMRARQEKARLDREAAARKELLGG